MDTLLELIESHSVAADEREIIVTPVHFLADYLEGLTRGQRGYIRPPFVLVLSQRKVNCHSCVTPFSRSPSTARSTRYSGIPSASEMLAVFAVCFPIALSA